MPIAQAVVQPEAPSPEALDPKAPMDLNALFQSSPPPKPVAPTVPEEPETPLDPAAPVDLASLLQSSAPVKPAAPAQPVEAPVAGDNPASEPAASGMDFLAGLSRSTTSPAPSKATPAKRPAATARAPAATGTTRSKAASNPKMTLYIGAGVGVAVVLLIVIGMALSSSGKHAKPKNVKYGLSEPQRKTIYCDLITAVDNYGEGDACKREWQAIGAERKLSMDIVGKILEEGFDAGWNQPAFDGYTAQKKANRVGWLKRRNELRTEPMFRKP